jgi:hypothetical protein
MIGRLLLALVILTALAVPLAAQPSDADTQARRIVEQPPYRGYRVEREVTPEQSAREWAPAQSGGDGEFLRPGDGRSGYRRSGRTQAPTRESSSRSRSDGSGGSDLSGLGWIGDVFTVIVWVMVILAALFGVYLLVRALIGLRLQRRARKTRTSREKTEPAAGTNQSPDAKPELPPEVFEDALELALREYDQALKAQNWGRAALVAYRIFWLRAGWTGCVESTDVRTWRDAVALVRAPRTRRQVSSLLGLVERVRYGSHAPDSDEFARWRSELDSLNPAEALK